jgi:CHASE2 domain-containing sensor protein
MEAYTKGYKAGFHHQPLFYAWIILANFALLIASLKWWKYSFYFHILFGIAIITLTLLSTIHILVPDWISPDA